MTLPRFYPIFDSPQWLERALPLGVQWVQLRSKNTDQDALRLDIRNSLALARAHGATLVINDHWQLAIEEGAEWLHLGQEDLDEADLSAIRRAGLKLGISTHDHAELERALALNPDYVALGPVYPTILKQMKWEQQGLPRVTEWKQRIGNIPLVAIGGMSVARAPGVFEAGADLISVVTDITLSQEPEARIKAWLEVCA